MRKEKKGITLISLVITIVILLILATISIATLTGKNGIVNNAEDARKLTENTNIKEEVEMTLLKVEESNDDIGTANKKIESLLKKLNESYKFLDKFETEEVDGKSKEVEVKIDDSEYLFSYEKDGQKTYFTVNLNNNEVTILDGNEYEETIYGKERTVVFRFNPRGTIKANEIINTITTNNNKKIKIPKAGNFVNNRFIGWDNNQDGKVDIGPEVTETRIMKDEEWWTLYVPEGSSVCIIERMYVPTNEILTSTEPKTLTNKSSYNVSAESVYDGKYFNGWSFDHGKSIVSTNTSYSFAIQCDTTITALYGDSPIEIRPAVALYGISRTRNDENKDICRITRFVGF